MGRPLVVSKGKLTQEQYQSVHDWLRYRYGVPMPCDNCGTNSLPKRQYNWSNKSGEYRKDRNDWQKLCLACHSYYDLFSSKESSWRREYCKKGHKQVLTNLYFSKHRTTLECRECRKIQRSKYLRKVGK